jgi:hypothetical protein
MAGAPSSSFYHFATKGSVARRHQPRKLSLQRPRRGYPYEASIVGACRTASTHSAPITDSETSAYAFRLRSSSYGGQVRSPALRAGRKLVEPDQSNLPDGQITHLLYHSAVQPPLRKYFGFPLTRIKSISLASRPCWRGVSRSSRTRGGMRWTRSVRLTKRAAADGEVVWF